jgi:hypothetical protein
MTPRRARRRRRCGSARRDGRPAPRPGGAWPSRRSRRSTGRGGPRGRAPRRWHGWRRSHRGHRPRAPGSGRRRARPHRPDRPAPAAGPQRPSASGAGTSRRATWTCRRRTRRAPGRAAARHRRASRRAPPAPAPGGRPPRRPDRRSARPPRAGAARAARRWCPEQLRIRRRRPTTRPAIVAGGSSIHSTGPSPRSWSACPTASFIRSSQCDCTSFGARRLVARQPSCVRSRSASRDHGVIPCSARRPIPRASTYWRCMSSLASSASRSCVGPSASTTAARALARHASAAVSTMRASRLSLSTSVMRWPSEASPGTSRYRPASASRAVARNTRRRAAPSMVTVWSGKDRSGSALGKGRGSTRTAGSATAGAAPRTLAARAAKVARASAVHSASLSLRTSAAPLCSASRATTSSRAWLPRVRTEQDVVQVCLGAAGQRRQERWGRGRPRWATPPRATGARPRGPR